MPETPESVGETPETAPEVPDELIVLAQAAESTYARTRPLDGGGWQRVPDAQVRRLITAVLPAHEATVRAKVAGEIEDADRDGFGSDYDRGLDAAAEIARGEQP